MKFSSAISETYKFDLVHCLLNRVLTICSNQINFYSSLNKLRKIFYQSALPVKFIEKIIKSKVNLLRSLKAASYDIPKKLIYNKLPLISE